MKIDYHEGVTALEQAAGRLGGTLTTAGPFQFRITVGDNVVKADLRDWSGTLAPHSGRGVEASLISAGSIAQEGERYSKIFSRRVAVTKNGLSVSRLVTAIEKCLGAIAKGKRLEAARDARENAQDARKAANEKALLESPLVSQGEWGGIKLDEDVLREEIRSIKVDSYGVNITLSSVSPARAIEILNLLNAKSPIVG